MKSTIHGSPSFSYVHLELEPGETFIAESGAMASMDVGIDVQAKFNGGFFKAILKKFFGGESLFVNHYTNNTNEVKKLTFVQGYPGDIKELKLENSSICLQPGAYVGSSPDLELGVEFAGFKSFFAREGLFRLKVSGTGTLFYGAYGGMLEREVNGSYIIDSSHLVAYDPQLDLNIQLAGGIFSSFFGGEGVVTRMDGQGKVVIQTRSLRGLADWVNPKL